MLSSRLKTKPRTFEAVLVLETHYSQLHGKLHLVIHDALSVRHLMGGWYLHYTTPFLCCFPFRYNEEKNFIVWVNEEDHMRIISMEKGGKMQIVFRRFVNGLKQVPILKS